MDSIKPVVDQTFARDFFTMVDRKNAQEYTSYFVEEGSVTFGNQAPLKGEKAILEGMTKFYDSLESMHHEIHNLWTESGVIISEAIAHYVNKGSTKRVDIPVVTIVNLDGALVERVQFYMDIAPLYQK